MGQVWSPVLIVTLDLMEKRSYPSVPKAKTRAMIRWLARRCW